MVYPLFQLKFVSTRIPTPFRQAIIIYEVVDKESFNEKYEYCESLKV